MRLVEMSLQREEVRRQSRPKVKRPGLIAHSTISRGSWRSGERVLGPFKNGPKELPSQENGNINKLESF